MKTIDYDWYIINTDRGILQADRNGELWLGGGRTFVKPASFWSYKEAKQARDKCVKIIKKKCTFRLKWTEIKSLRRIY